MAYVCRNCDPIPTPKPTPKVAMKAPRMPQPVMIDDEDDLCPVCDGDCTCNAAKPSPTTALPPLPDSSQIHPPSLSKSTNTITQHLRLPAHKSRKNSGKESKADEARRMVSSFADIILDQDGHAWKSKSSLKRAGPREFAKMAISPHASVTKDAPIMKPSGTSWIVIDQKKPASKGLEVVGYTSRKRAVFESTSDSDSDVADARPLAETQSLKIRHIQHPVQSHSSDLDSESDIAAKVHLFNSSSDSAGSSDSEAIVGIETRLPHSAVTVTECSDDDSSFDSENEISGRASPPLVEYEVALDDHDETDSNAGSESSTQSSVGDFVSDDGSDADDMDIDAIFAAADESGGEESEESDIDLFVENALNGGWSSSDEYEDSDEDSIIGVMEHADDSASECISDKMTDTFEGDFEDAVFPEPDDVLEEVMDSKPKFDRSRDEEAVESSHISKPCVNFDIKKTLVGPNGEIITTTKSMAIQLPKPKSTTSRKKSSVNAQKKQATSGVALLSKEAADDPATASSHASLASLIAALNGLGNPVAGPGVSQKEKSAQIAQAVLNALKNSNVAGGSALAVLMDFQKRLPTAKASNQSSSNSTTTKSLTDENAAQNVAALAVLAAALAASKGKLSQKKKPESSDPHTSSSKSLDELIAAAIPAILALQKQNASLANLQLPHSHESKKSETIKPMVVSTSPSNRVTLDDVFDTEALEFSDSGDYNNTDEFDLNEHFSRWTRVPIGTFRKTRKASISKVNRKEFKKALRNSKTPAVTLSAPNSQDSPIFFSLSPLLQSE
ncbi:hypothetical protein BC830DRAFT_140369 [Chytriomyces sp. MP71]|nr:hypothetical protein BC830DRAFT_140369 [Chytriomyces sp. MP71]